MSTLVWNSPAQMFGLVDSPKAVTSPCNANCGIQHTKIMVSAVGQQRLVADPRALTTEDKPSATSSGRS